MPFNQPKHFFNNQQFIIDIFQVKVLNSEIKDLQQEFEDDRTDYLDTIRKQDQQLILLQQILDKVQPTLRKDSNYSNVEKIKQEARWNDESQRWSIPELVIAKTKLPPAGQSVSICFFCLCILSEKNVQVYNMVS